MLFRFGQLNVFLAAAATLVAFSAPAEAADGAGNMAVAGKIGGNWSLLSQPDDPQNEPTLLSGSAFSGMGFTAGVSGFYEFAEVQGASFELEAGLHYSYHSGEGFEGIGEQSRTLTLSTQMVQIPILVHLKNGSSAGGFRIGAGLVPMLGLQSGATVEVVNSDQPAEPLETSPATHLGLSAVLGYDIPINPSYSVPLEIRVAWDPAVATSTRERFPDFVANDDTGAYQVAYNWQLFFMTGIRYEL